MTRKYFLLSFNLFFLLQCPQLFSQEYNTMEGLIILQNNDSIAGSIKIRNDIYEEVSFKANTSTDFKIFGPSDIKSLEYEGGYHYDALEIKEGEKAFLLRIVSGHLSLYQFYQKLFIKTSDGSVIELQHDEDKAVDRHLIEDKRYVRSLVFLTSGCPQLKRKIERVNYLATDISNLIEEYNQCVDPSYEAPTRNVANLRTEAGVRAGIGISKMQYLTQSFLYSNATFGPNSSILGGVFFRLTFRGKLSAQPEMILSKKESHFSGKLSSTADDQQIDVSLTSLEFPLSIYYTFPTQNIRPFISFGGVAAFALKKEATRHANGSDITLNMDNDFLGYKMSFGALKSFGSKYVAGVEYSISNTYGNRNYLIQNFRWFTQEITLRVSLDLTRSAD